MNEIECAVITKIRLLDKELESAWRNDWNKIYEEIKPYNNRTIRLPLEKFNELTVGLIRVKAASMMATIKQIVLESGSYIDQNAMSNIQLFVLDYFIEDNFAKRWNTFLGAVERKYSSYGLTFDRQMWRTDLIESLFIVGVKNNLRDVTANIQADFTLLNGSKQIVTPISKDTQLRYLFQSLELKPNFCGLGINLNNIIEKLFNNNVSKCICFLMFIYTLSPLISNAFAQTYAGQCQQAYTEKKYSEAHKSCLIEAELGSASAQLLLGLLYGQGNGVIQDYNESLKWYMKSAEQGDSAAQFNIALLYLYGNGVNQNYDESLKWALESAKNGDAGAQYLVGDIYNSKHDLDKALIWFKIASASGSAGASLELAQMHNFGTGVRKNRVEAFRWYKIAAELGSSTAQYNLAMQYLVGDVLQQNKEEAFKLLSKAAEKDEYLAPLELGNLYYDGEGTKKDLVEAAKWFRKAADSGLEDAQYKLGSMYYDGEGVQKDYTEAASLFRKAAEKGNLPSQFLLGYMYSEGLGVTKDYSESVKWHSKAAEKNVAGSQVELGRAYSSGKGIPKNYSEAAKWFTAAALQGDKRGQGKLGAFYSMGQGVQKDDIKALAWVTLAATAADESAVKLLDILEKNMKSDQILQAQQLATVYQIDIEQNKAKLAAKKSLALIGKINPDYTPLKVPDKSNPTFTANDYAVIIGIEKYRSVPATEFAAADAAKVREFITAFGIHERNIEFLTDDRATLSDIRKVIETKLPKMVNPTSRVIVFYAGHGAPGADKGDSYLVPYDGDPSFLSDTAYPLARLYDRLSRLPAKEVLVVLDSCFSGAGGRSVLAQGTRPLVMVRDTLPPSSKKMIVLTSASGNQITTSLPEVGHGAFTYFFLRALQEGKHDLGEVFAYLQTRVADEAKRRNVEQNPVIYPSADKLKGRFVFAK